MTHQQIAEVMGCSRALVQLIERGALRKLRRALERMGIDAQAAVVRDPVCWWGEGETSRTRRLRERRAGRRRDGKWMRTEELVKTSPP